MIAASEPNAGSELAGRRHCREVAAVLALFAVACAIRLLCLGQWSFWADELATLRDAQNLREVMGYPIGYVLIGVWVKAWGVSEFTARFLPAIVGAVTVPVIYWVGRSLFTPRAGILAAAFLTLSSFHLFFSQFARYYTLLMLLSLLAMWAIHIGIEKHSPGRIVAGLLLLGLAFWTHWSVGLLLPALVIYVMWMWTDREYTHKWTLAGTLLILLLLCGGIVLAPCFAGFFRGWMGGEGFSLRRACLTALKIGYRLDVGVLLCALIGVLFLFRMRDRSVKWLLPYALAPAILVAVFVGFSQGGSRFAIIVAPPVILLAARGIDLLFIHGNKGSQRVGTWAVLALVLFLSVNRDVAYFTVEQGQRPRWREAAEYYSGLKPETPPLLIASTPEIVAYYGGGRARALAELGEAEFAALFVREAERPLAYLLVEHVANVAPTPAQRAVLTERGVLVKRWPLRVGPLDYSMSLYTNRESGLAAEGL